MPVTEACAVFPGPCQVALAVADVSRHIWQESSLGNASCLPGRLQDKVPQVKKGFLMSTGRFFTQRSVHLLISPLDNLSRRTP